MNSKRKKKRTGNRKRKKGSVKPVVVDTSPLLLLLMGFYRPDMIESSKVMGNYSRKEFEALELYLRHRRIIITPHILAEISNLSKKGFTRDEFGNFLKSSILFIGAIGEDYIQKERILSSPDFPMLGFTDVSIILSARQNNAEVVTADYPLRGKCIQSGIKAYTITELSEQTRYYRMK